MKKKAIIIMLVMSAFFIYGCTNGNNERQIRDMNPQEIVTLYYASFNNKEFRTMYTLISDGYKEIEPTAKTYEDFEKEMKKYFDSASGMKLQSVKEISNDGSTAVVDYKLELYLNSGLKVLDSSFTLKKRENGWKLIHPYGDKIDTA